MDSVSFSELLNTLPRLLIGFSVMDGIFVPPEEKRNWSATFPFLNTKDLDFVGLKFMHAHVMTFSRPFSSHLQPGTDVVDTVRSSINARIGGWWTPDLDRGPLHSGSADLASMFIARAKMITDAVQPVIIPFSNLCHSDDTALEVTLNLKLL